MVENFFLNSASRKFVEDSAGRSLLPVGHHGFAATPVKSALLATV
jgi:hypothetical protein